MTHGRAPALLHEFFARAARDHADRPAVDVPPGIDRPVRRGRSYAELDQDARRIAWRLRGIVEGECVVAILLGRGGPELYAAQLGVLRAGAAYVCLDAAFPDEHLRFVLADAGAVAALSDARGTARLRAAAPELPHVIDVASCTADGGVTATPWSSPSSLAYLIYTSGTTGRPKGVMIEHGSIANLVAADLGEFGLGPGDRVAQGSSPAYDSSVEEIWLALAAGATVVPMDDEVVRRGPDLVGWLREERITVLCPPPTLLRTTGCAEPARALPQLRLVYAGGEALPQDLADAWARGRRFVNGYGPTECTVTVVRGDVRPGQPVTIGWPVAGHRALVLDAELREVSDGAPGELCISGPGLARGYLGRPELTAERFVQHPSFGRIYRTGDRVRRGSDGALWYEGRLDAQVKVRGHRVELEEIERRLVQCEGVREAACRVQGGDVLAAFVVPADRAAPPVFDALTAALRAAVPEHMVPSRFALCDALPTTVGGKLDRKALPEIGAQVGGRAAEDATERTVAAAFATALGTATAPCDVDFFELGGDSVRAAVAVSQLRADPGTESLTVRDVYELRTVERLADAARTRAAIAAPDVGSAVAAEPSGVHPVLVTVVQTAWLALELALGSGLAYALAFVVLPEVLRHVAPWLVVLVLPVAVVLARILYGPLALLAAVALKRALIGRYTARRAPVWGWWYLRHWIVLRSVRWVPWGVVQGTELQAVALRALGARVGARVHLHRGVDLLSGGWDLLDVGDDVSVAQDAALGLCELEDGHVVVGPVRLGRGATIEVRAGVAAHASVGDGACVAALAAVPAGVDVPAGERWDGVPARPAGRAAAVPGVTDGGRSLGPFAHACLLVGARTGVAWLVGVPFLLGVVAVLEAWGVDGAALRAWLADPRVTPGGLEVALGVVVGSVPCGLALQGLVLRWGPRPPTGVLRTRSLAHVLALLRARTVEAAGLWLSGTLFWPLWLRLAGAHIGARCEISTVVDVLPEQVTIGEESFFADGIYLGGPRVDRGTVTVGPVELGAGTFLGNHVVIPPETVLPPGVLLGVCTVADPARVLPGTSWFGHPPFELPRREVIDVDRRLTFEPGWVRYVNRLLWELARFLLPVVPALALLVWWEAIARAESAGPALWLGLVPAVTWAVGAGLAAFVLLLKWWLLGRVAPGQHALWSCWCSRWDFLYVAWGMLARGALAGLAGTLWLACYLRAMGMRIGRRVVLGPGFAQVVDPDMLELGDGATVDTHFQAHSFEDRVLKIDRVRIGAGATLSRGSVVLYGADLGDGCQVAEHSVVMKNERLSPGRRYAGVPTVETGRAAEKRVLGAWHQGRAFSGRIAAFDVARGIAVLGMIWLHLVATEGGTNDFENAAAFIAAALYGKPAALFCVLAGVSWSIQAERRRGRGGFPVYVVRRALALGLAGVALAHTVWPTEILTPLALMMPLVMLACRGGRVVLGLSVLVLLAAVPLADHWFGDYAWSDWNDDGTRHLAESGFGWATLRYYLLTGNYPLVPWLAFPLIGALLGRAVLVLQLALPLAVASIAWVRWAAAHEDALSPQLLSTWVPTTLPFVAVGASVALGAIGLLRAGGAALPWLACLGRASLTHYVLHVLVVFVPLRAVWPAEDWSITVGVAAFAAYVAAAVPLSVWWFRRAARGPLEATWSWLGGGG